MLEKAKAPALQFHIKLLGIKPPIWRRILVPGNYSFWDLHTAIQDAMGWTDTHLHGFRCLMHHGTMSGRNKMTYIGVPSDEDVEKVMPDWSFPLRLFFKEAGQKARYFYDFGDGWEHEVLLEKLVEAGKGDQLPLCLGGARGCPPEDCGGPSCYPELLKILSDPSHPEHREKREWVGEYFSPEQFYPEEVIFDDPQERLKSFRELFP